METYEDESGLWEIRKEGKTGRVTRLLIEPKKKAASKKKAAKKAKKE
tara:strand:- start:2507 stop:2647 length:141 start_codon:yes stop_codon:yes gene_type:complete